MRLINFLRNSTYSVGSFVLLALLGIIVRKFFTEYLPIEFLGLEGLFGSIIAILSLAEMGISNVISYSLYKEIANNNQKGINILMSIYRYIYMIIGMFIFCVGVVLFFFLPIIIQDHSVEWQYIQFVYVLQICTVLSTYFLAYRRTLLTADQRDFVIIQIDTACKFVNACVQIFAIVILQSYVFYAISALLFNVLANGIISWRVKKIYPFLNKVKITWKEMYKRKFFKDVKNFMIHKIAYLLYSGLDVVIVSTFLGLKVAGILSNYILIHTGIYNIMYKFLQGIIPGIGNLVYSESKDKAIKIYNMLDFAYTMLGGYICCVYIVAFQPFIILFFGEKFLLPQLYVILLAINTFLAIQFENAWNFRATYGVYENDRIYMILSAISKLIIAILGVQYFGAAGVVLGTIVGICFIIYGRVQFCFKIIFQKKMKLYLLKHFLYTVLIVMEIFLIKWMLCQFNFVLTYMNIILECAFSGIVMLVMQCILFYHTQEFKDLLNYIRIINKLLKEKFL